MSSLKILGQARPSDTNAASLYSPRANTAGIIERILVCNQSGADSSFRIFLDADGSTYDETTALFWDAPLGANLTWEIVGPFGIINASGNLGVRSANGNALTFTAFGRD